MHKNQILRLAESGQSGDHHNIALKLVELSHRIPPVINQARREGREALASRLERLLALIS